MCHLMAKEERDNLARCIQKLLRATYALPDPDGLMSKLRSALDGLVAMVTAPQETAVESTIGVKRHVDERDEDLEGTFLSLKSRPFALQRILLFPDVHLGISRLTQSAKSKRYFL